jgi:hypothetical protein
LYSPYLRKKSVWKWADDDTLYEADIRDIDMVLDEPELLTHRLGDVYFKFKELRDV